MSATKRPARTVLDARDLLDGHEQANRAVMRALVDQLATSRGLPAPPWTALNPDLDPDAVAKVRQHLSALEVGQWDAADLGTAYEHLLGRAGGWFTPPELAAFTVRMSVGQQLEHLADHPDPGNVLQVLAVDPACGCGMFLITAARLIATRYAARLFGHADDLAASLVLPEVMRETIFGIDIDPTAIDIAKAVLWFEVDGREPFTWMDRNVICGNPLAGPHVEPPRLTERLAERQER